MSRYTLHEPFPHYNHVNSMPFGRGGAGNRTSSTIPSKSRSHGPTASTQQQQQMPPNTITVNPNHAHPGPRFSTGRGGAGNMHGSTQRDERQMFHFDEELEREKRKEKALSPVYHIGRGGEGNKVLNTRRGSDGSDGSEGSGSKGRRSLDWVKGLARK